MFLPSTLGARAATKSVSRSAGTEILPRTLAASVARDFLASCSKTETGARKSNLKEELTREPRQMDVRTRSIHENISARKQRIQGGCAASVDIQQHSKRLRWLSTQRDAAARVTAARKNMKWLCDPMYEETKCVWQCRDCGWEGLSVADLVHPTRSSILQSFSSPPHRDSE